MQWPSVVQAGSPGERRRLLLELELPFHKFQRVRHGYLHDADRRTGKNRVLAHISVTHGQCRRARQWLTPEPMSVSWAPHFMRL